METINKIPTSKIQRVGKIVQMGANVGVNYLKYYGEKLVGSEEEAKAKLNESNATDIYDGLKKLKGSALKVAQMMSMEQSLLPQAYVEKFSLSQFSVPPLSAALVQKTFKRYFGKTANELFDEFNFEAINAASIGQVHLAKLNGKKLAVKIQYPGIAASISSDLALVKPIAMKMFNLKGKEVDRFFIEVEHKLLEETDYNLELKQSNEVKIACSRLPNLVIPTYYEQYSNEKILTMDWMDGVQISTFAEQNKSLEDANVIGQTLWDFYMYQLHVLKKVHADPHPGNFMVSPSKELIAIDFGCMKEIPMEFYTPYFELVKPEVLNNRTRFEHELVKLEILNTDDSEKDKTFYADLFHELLSLFTLPLQAENFNFADSTFFDQISNLAERYSKDDELKKMDGNRGSKHFIYMNRTFFGLYSLMNMLKPSSIEVNRYKNYVL